ncbi:MAG: hypothetical protein ACPGJV_06360 [Bacteriovoracaceae bacterium]
MYLRINSLIPCSQSYEVVSLFGYCSAGLPGLELKGCYSRAQVLKEKMIFITKSLGLQVPLKKFNLCLDAPSKRSISSIDLEWIELPMLLLYWSLAGHLSIKNMEYCFSFGKFRPSGEFDVPKIKEDFLVSFQKEMKELSGRDITYLLSEDYRQMTNIQFIPLESILSFTKLVRKKSLSDQKQLNQQGSYQTLSMGVLN